ncbi:MAG TPA: YdeI/OmpD-associated family protein [Candidatus Paceibacterota bacterium]|nr:YdeI/OmpD-associated family protein [Candidatus Paceibacterota bacterium]
MSEHLLSGTIHPLPADVRTALLADPKVRTLWQDITPLARNEWICWVTSGKKEETRGIRIKKMLSKMRSGMRRPCCWAGCPHRSDKPLSRSQKFVYGKK